jgi:uncharacterized protein (UPF0212 family)
MKMPNFNVFLEGAWFVKDVATGEDAIGIAISEAGKRLNPKLEFVGVDVGTMSCASCDEDFMSVYVVADTALVGLLFQMKVYEAESEEHASRIATSVIGKALRDVPLKIVEVEEFVSDSRPPRQNTERDGRPPRQNTERDGRPPSQNTERDGRPPRQNAERDGRPPRQNTGRDSRPPRQTVGRDSRPPRQNAERDRSRSEQSGRGEHRDKGERVEKRGWRE